MYKTTRVKYRSYSNTFSSIARRQRKQRKKAKKKALQGWLPVPRPPSKEVEQAFSIIHDDQ